MFSKLKVVVALLCGVTFSVQAKLVDIQHWQTEKGVQVYFVESHEIPIVDLRVMFHAGSARDGNLPGLAALTNTMLDEGTKKFNSDQVAQAFESVGAIYSGGVTRDTAQLGLRSLSDKQYLSPALDVLSSVLTEPAFPEHELERLRKQTITSLQYQEQQPGTIASKAFTKALYGNAPYAHPRLGNLETVQKMTQKDLVEFYQQYYVANNAVLVMVGDLTQADAKALAENITRNLPAGVAAKPLPEIAKASKQGRQQIKFPSTQTHVLMGQLGLAKGSPDYFPAKVGNYILGEGVLVSRLFNDVRNKAGLAYHVSSSFATLQREGPFSIVLQTRNQETDNAIKIARKTLDDFIQQGPTDKEIDLAKKNITQGYAINLASNSSILSAVSEIAFYGLPLDYLDNYVANINAVEKDDIKELFQRLIQPDRFVTITVGNSLN